MVPCYARRVSSLCLPCESAVLGNAGNCLMSSLLAESGPCSTLRRQCLTEGRCQRLGSTGCRRCLRLPNAPLLKITLPSSLSGPLSLSRTHGTCLGGVSERKGSVRGAARHVPSLSPFRRIAVSPACLTIGTSTHCLSLPTRRRSSASRNLSGDWRSQRSQRGLLVRRAAWQAGHPTDARTVQRRAPSG